jgi:DMSO/TMAO reductase YedYZ molybdopterin-dependent catalytic subunit
MLRRLFFSLVFFVGFQAFAAEPVLKIVGPEKIIELTATEFAALPRIEVKLPDQREKAERTYSGVTMRALLTRVGAPLGEKLRGSGLATGVIVRTKDNYVVLFSLAEFDENFSNRTIILADQEDGQPLPPSSAPFRMITPGDKRGARSARQVTSIEVVSLAKP